MTIRLSDEERQAQSIGEDKLELAAALLHIRGYVVLDNMFQPDRLQTLQEAVGQARKQTGGNNDGNPLSLPAAAPFVDPDIAENPLMLGVIDQIIGADCVLRVIGADIRKPGAAVSSELAIESKPLFPETEHVRLPAHKLRVTIPLTDLNEGSGAPELWPGSHAQPEHIEKHYSEAVLRKLAEGSPSVKVNVPAGAVLICDSKLWHRECANESAEEQVSLTLTYQRWWDITSPRLVISEALYSGASARLKRLFRFEALPVRKKAEMGS